MKTSLSPFHVKAAEQVWHSLDCAVQRTSSNLVSLEIKTSDEICVHKCGDSGQNRDKRVSYMRVSMGLTVSRKTANNLAVRRKNERILTVSRNKMLTVKKSNHKIRSRDLLLSLMCYAFMCSGNEN